MLDIDRVQTTAEKYKLPLVEALMVDVNRQGINLPINPTENARRVRFSLDLKIANSMDGDSATTTKFYLSGPTNQTSIYTLRNNQLFCGGIQIGEVEDLSGDDATLFYPRREGTVAVLNPKSKSNCRGCKFCYSDALLKNDKPLPIEQYISAVIANLQKVTDQNLSTLHCVSTVTGRFKDKTELLEYLNKLRHDLSQEGYDGELLYMGSEFDASSIRILEDLKPFTLIHTVETFGRRKELLRRKKAERNLAEIRESLSIGKSMGLETSFTYLIGLEKIEIIIKEMREMLGSITRIPTMNIFQPHSEAQGKLLTPEAKSLEYFLAIREELEKLFIEAKIGKPRTWENYRRLWYLKFGGTDLPQNHLPQKIA